MSFLITFLGSFLIWFMFLGLFVLWMIDGRIKKEQVIHALIAAFIAWTIAEIIKFLFPTLRPFQTNGLSSLSLMKPIDGAFPSGHTSAAFAIAVTVFLHDKKVGLLFLIAGAVMGIARVLGNVHYPIDIIGGVIVGSIVAFIIEKRHFRP